MTTEGGWLSFKTRSATYALVALACAAICATAQKKEDPRLSPRYLVIPTEFGGIEEREVKGYVSISLFVSPAGTVGEARLVEETIAPRELAPTIVQPLLEAVREWTYPKTKSRQRIAVRFYFEISPAPAVGPPQRVVLELPGSVRIVGHRIKEHADPLPPTAPATIRRIPGLEKLHVPLVPPVP